MRPSQVVNAKDELERVVLITLCEVNRFYVLLRVSLNPHDPQHRFTRRSNVVEAKQTDTVLPGNPERRRASQQPGHARSPEPIRAEARKERFGSNSRLGGAWVQLAGTPIAYRANRDLEAVLEYFRARRR